MSKNKLKLEEVSYYDAHLFPEKGKFSINIELKQTSLQLSYFSSLSISDYE
jgi:hypothetical protein